MDYVELYRGARLLAVYPVNGRVIEIGRALGCDVLVDDPDVRPRHGLLVPSPRGLLYYESGPRREAASPRPLQTGEHLPLGKEHALCRREATAECPAGTCEDEAATAPTCEELDARVPGELALRVGLGPEARSVRLTERPLCIGRAADNDIVLHDRAVSAYHCRVECGQGFPAIRDLGSRNGTFVNGVQVVRALLGPGTAMRIGHTELRCGLRQLARPQDAGVKGRGLEVIAASSEMVAVLAEVARLSSLSWPVLLRGETGTGKEGLALSLHKLGPRAAAPFIALNAAGLSPQLVESELFGHERGAFTGASSQHPGVFEQAHRGTLFLDEVGELPLPLQAKLLRVLEGGDVRRLGGQQVVRVDTRLVCATHRDLPNMVREGRFRADLYYRIARLVIDVPPLRSRPKDIVALAKHFLHEAASTLGPRQLTKGGEARLLAHDWPGNVRELRNVVGMAATFSGGAILDGPLIEAALLKVGLVSARRTPPVQLHQLVETHGGNISAAARAIGWPRSTLRDRLQGMRPQAV